MIIENSWQTWMEKDVVPNKGHVWIKPRLQSIYENLILVYAYLEISFSYRLFPWIEQTTGDVHEQLLSIVVDEYVSILTHILAAIVSLLFYKNNSSISNSHHSFHSHTSMEDHFYWTRDIAMQPSLIYLAKINHDQFFSFISKISLTIDWSDNWWLFRIIHVPSRNSGINWWYINSTNKSDGWGSDNSNGRSNQSVRLIIKW